MADTLITDQTPFVLLVDGSVAAGQITADLRPGQLLAGVLLAANDLSDVASAAQARTNLGGTATGVAVFTAASTTAGQTALGATSTGRGLFTAANAGVARSAIVANILPIANRFDSVLAATAEQQYYTFGADSGFVSSVMVTLYGALAGGDFAFTADVVTAGVATPISFASTTIPEAGSAAGTTARFVPNAAAPISTLSTVRITIAGANMAEVAAGITVTAVY